MSNAKESESVLIESEPWGLSRSGSSKLTYLIVFLCTLPVSYAINWMRHLSFIVACFTLIGSLMSFPL